MVIPGFTCPFNLHQLLIKLTATASRCQRWFCYSDCDASVKQLSNRARVIGHLYSGLNYGMNPLLKRSDMARDGNGVTVYTQFYLPHTHEPYLLLHPSHRASLPTLAGTQCAYSRRNGQAELTWVAAYTNIDFPHQELNPGYGHPSSTINCRNTFINLTISFCSDVLWSRLHNALVL